MPSRARNDPGRSRPLALVIAGFGVVWLVYQLARAFGGGIAIDYLAFATGGRVVSTDPTQLYSVTAQAHAQSQLMGISYPISASFPVRYVNPPFAAELIRPLAALPLQTGTDLFCLILVLALAASALLIRRALPAGWSAELQWLVAISLGLSAAADYGVLLGQWSPLLLLLALLAYLQAERRPLLAGALLSALLIKAQVIWLVPLVLVIAEEWRLLLGLVGGGLVLAGLSVLIIGVHASADYVSLLAGFESTQEAFTSQSLPGVVVAATNNASWGTWLEIPLGAAALALVACCRRRLRARPQLVVAFGLALSLLTAAHVNPQDLVLLVPLALLGVARWPQATLLVTGLLSAGVVQVVSWAGFRVDTLAMTLGIGLATWMWLLRPDAAQASATVPAAGE